MFLDISTMAHAKAVSKSVKEIVDHAILRRLESISTLDGERGLLDVISHPGTSCAEDLWLLNFFDPVQITLQTRALATAQLLQVRNALLTGHPVPVFTPGSFVCLESMLLRSSARCLCSVCRK